MLRTRTLPQIVVASDDFTPEDCTRGVPIAYCWTAVNGSAKLLGRRTTLWWMSWTAEDIRADVFDLQVFKWTSSVGATRRFPFSFIRAFCACIIVLSGIKKQAFLFFFFFWVSTSFGWMIVCVVVFECMFELAFSFACENDFFFLLFFTNLLFMFVYLCCTFFWIGF